MTIYQDAQTIIDRAIREALPASAVQEALAHIDVTPYRSLTLVAIGKAAWQMANAAHQALGEAITRGIVITKYHHSQGPIGPLVIMEAGHPVPDENTLQATKTALGMVASLTEQDAVLFLVSGGGSALFEDCVVPLDELQGITRDMLKKGMDIVEMNTVRKRLSRVKGGRFGLACAPAQVFQIVLSDIVGDPLDMIASGPAYPDSATKEDARRIVSAYGLALSKEALDALDEETPKRLGNVQTQITGSVKALCASCQKACRALGYQTQILTTSLRQEAAEVGSLFASIAEYHQDSEQSLAFIMGGETVVHVKGNGKGGRNQELALACAKGLQNTRHTLLFSLGSDGTDGPTDAAGGLVTEHTVRRLLAQGVSIDAALADNDAYHALKAVDGLIVTGPTGTNVNDVSVLLIKRP